MGGKFNNAERKHRGLLNWFYLEKDGINTLAVNKKMVRES